jgi:hypothetical protein
MKPATTLAALSIVALVATVAVAQAPAGRASEPKPPDAPAGEVNATGVYPVTTESSLVIRGVPGQIVVTTKPATELRFVSRAKDRSGGPRPIAVSFDGTTVTMGPPPGGTLGEGTLRVQAPASFAVRVEADGGTVLVDGFAGAVGLVGKGTVVRAQSLTGPLDADVQGGSLTLTKLVGPATVRIHGASGLTATDLRGSLDLNSQGSTVKATGVGGACRVEANGGSAELSGLAAGGDFHMTESPLRLTAGKGDVTVVSDAAVTFANMVGSMRLDMDGASLRGQGNQGPVRVQARRTDVTLAGISGDLDVDVTRGKFALQRVSGAVTAAIFAGDAKFLELQGPLRLDMNGGNAEVTWSAVTGAGDSVLNNHGGDIAVRLPGNASCRVSARTSSGRITSELPSIKVPADATEAEGTLGQGKGPEISIEADGNIRLSGGVTVQAPAPPPKG